MSINKVFITGNLTRDPGCRMTGGGTAVLDLGVAVNDRRRNPSTGEWEDVPDYVDCAVFGKRAEALAAHLSKGCKVAIEGKLRYSSWDKDGERRSKLSVIVDEIEFMSRKAASPAAQDGGGAYPAAASQAAPAPVSAAQGASGGGVPATICGIPGTLYDEDVPF